MPTDEITILINGRRCITIDEASDAYHYSPGYIRAFIYKHCITYHVIGTTGFVDADALHSLMQNPPRRQNKFALLCDWITTHDALGWKPSRIKAELRKDGIRTSYGYLAKVLGHLRKQAA